jgi:hypothetical protein
MDACIGSGRKNKFKLLKTAMARIHVDVEREVCLGS